MPVKNRIAWAVLTVAWGLYLASLVLPAIEVPPNNMEAPGTGVCHAGGLVLLMLLQSIICPLLFICYPWLYINLFFLASPILLRARTTGGRPRSPARNAFRLSLIAAGLAWFTPIFFLLPDEFEQTYCVGFYLWIAAVSLLPLAFGICLPPDDRDAARGADPLAEEPAGPRQRPGGVL